MQMLSSTSTKINTLETLPVTGCPLDTELFEVGSSASFPPMQAIPSQIGWKDTLGDCDKSLTKVKVNGILFHPPVCWISHFITFISFMCPEMMFRKIYYIFFSGTEMRLTSLWLPVSFFIKWERCLPKQPPAMPASLTVHQKGLLSMFWVCIGMSVVLLFSVLLGDTLLTVVLLKSTILFTCLKIGQGAKYVFSCAEALSFLTGNKTGIS